MASAEDKTQSIQLAALWLHSNRSAISEPIIPALRSRFHLSILDAIEATKQAHALAYPRT